MRHLAVFFVIGALLLAAKRLLAPQLFPPALTVHVDAHASAADVEHAIDEALLLEQALLRGGALLDPLVRDQLARVMHVPEADRGAADAGADQRIDQALALGVPRVDPLVRRRLATQSEQLMMARADAEQATDAALEAYVRAHADRYAHPPRFCVQQVLVSRDRHGDDLPRAAEALRARLPVHAVDARVLGQLGDPSLLPALLVEVSARELDARFGPGFAAGLEGAPVDAWSGPVASAYGMHFVRVTAREPARVPPLSQIRARVLGDYRHDRRAEALRDGLRALRTQYRVDVRRQPS